MKGFLVKPHTKDIRVTYEWHINDIRVRTIDIRITYELNTNNMRIT